MSNKSLGTDYQIPYSLIYNKLYCFNLFLLTIDCGNYFCKQ